VITKQASDIPHTTEPISSQSSTEVITTNLQVSPKIGHIPSTNEEAAPVSTNSTATPIKVTTSTLSTGIKDSQMRSQSPTVSTNKDDIPNATLSAPVSTVASDSPPASSSVLYSDPSASEDDIVSPTVTAAEPNLDSSSPHVSAVEVSTNAGQAYVGPINLPVGVQPDLKFQLNSKSAAPADKQAIAPPRITTPVIANHSSIHDAVHPLLIYSTRYEIRSYDLALGAYSKSASNSLNVGSNSAWIDQQHSGNKHSSSRTLMGGLKNTVGLDFYYSDKESFIFWTDVIEERIFRGTLVNGSITNVDPVIQSGLATAEGLAVDWVAKNIYWVESTLDHIEVANMNGSARRTLIAGDMESPRAIALDPRFGLMFWTDWDRRSPRIERATMSGDDRRTLINIKEVHGGWPNGLTLDYQAMKVYWIDANSDSIHVADYEGNNHRLLLSKVKSLGHPFSITLYESNLYWTDWKTNTVSMVNKLNGSEVKDLQRQTSRPLDIKVIHPSRQPPVDNNLNPCWLNNGNCSHLCLLTTNHQRKCECPHLMRITHDGVTCETDERVLLIGRTNEIRAVDIIEPLYHVMAPISVPRVFNPRQFEYDAKSRNIFWADSQTNEVKRAQLAGNVIETIVDVIIESPSGLALDWISGNIYVTSAPQVKSSGKIFISNLNGEFISVLMDSSQGIVSPRSLAINPLLGLLFCIDENENSEPILFMATMDGRNKRIIASNHSQISNPSNLAIDLIENRVYWINQAIGPKDTATIQYYDIASNQIGVALDEAQVDAEHRFNPSSLCVDGDYLIMSSRQPTEAIIRAKKNNTSDRMIYKTQSLDQISALRVYNASVQVGTNACSKNNGGCSQLCIPTSQIHRTCKCTMGYSANPMNETECIGKSEFLIFSYNLGMKGISLEPNSSPDDYYLPPIHRAFRASSIDFVHRDHSIYWVDNEEGSITRINQDTTNYQVIVQGLESEECIAVDWVAGNIYWLDPYYDIIEVARLNGINRYVIISGDMEKPNGIVVNPLKGYLAWSDIGSTPKIEVSLLDGSNRKVIVNSKLSHVDDLAIDYIDDFIYWVDSTQSLVERVRPDGSDRQLVFSNPLNNLAPQHHLVSIAVHNEHLFVADSVFNQGSIIRIDKNDPSNRMLIQQHLGDGIRDIAIFTPQTIPAPSENPCVKDNGGCQDLCLYLGEPGKKRCICSHARLKSDGLTCKPYDTFILFSKLSQIDSLNILDDEHYNNSPYPPITVEPRANIISLTVDYEAQRVIYSEITRDQICSILFNGTDKKVLVEKQSYVEGVAFANNQLYWTNIHDKSISRLNISSSGVLQTDCTSINGTSSCKTATTEKLVVLTQDDKPRGIAFDSCTNYVYWTNWNDEASIQRASPHNNYRIESIITTNIKVPNGIAIDQKRRKLYWCDAKLDKIETCDMDGTHRVVLISASPQHPFALAIWKNNVYWTDWVARSVFRADKYTGQQVVQIRKVVQRPMGIVVAAGDLLECPVDNCSIDNGGCPPGYTCITHDTGSGQPYIHCREPDELNHDLVLPTPKCKHLGNSKLCDGTYHDIIMDNLDRYTELAPVEPNHTPSMPPVYPQFMTTFSPPISTTYSPPVQRTPSSMSSKHKQSDNRPSRTTTPGTPTSSAPITQATTTTTSTVNSVQQGLAPNGSTYTPCQISPAALHPTIISTTTDTSFTEHECKSSGQFKCYLSERLVCILKEKRCDGNFDCPSKEDENDCYLSSRGQYNIKHETNWHRFVPVILIILAAAIAALFMVFGTRTRRRWFVNSNGPFSHHELFDDNGTNIEISNPMFDDDDSANLVHCAFSIDLNERTTNFSNPLYERRVLLVNDKNPSTNPSA